MRRHITWSIILLTGAILLATALLLQHTRTQSDLAWHQELAVSSNGESQDGVKIAAVASLADEEDDQEQDEEDQEKEEEPKGWNRLWDAPKLG